MACCQGGLLERQSLASLVGSRDGPESSPRITANLRRESSPRIFTANLHRECGRVVWLIVKTIAGLADCKRNTTTEQQANCQHCCQL
jgi:hypothetical protein